MLHDFYRQQELHQEKKQGISLEELRTEKEKKERKKTFKRIHENIDKLRNIIKEL